MTFKHLKLSSSKEGEKMINVPNVLYENRYCNQDDFSILVCGGFTKNVPSLNDVYKLKSPNFDCSHFPSMIEARYYCETAVISSDVVVVGGCNNDDRRLYSVEIFDSNKKSWFYKTELSDKRTGFCIYSFKQNLYIIGGANNNDQSLKSCFVYNMKCDIWSQIADINEVEMMQLVQFMNFNK